jgi:dephospho-CoA kinase
MPVIFVFGNIGSGKSEFCADLRDLGATVIDADALVASLYETDHEMVSQIEFLLGLALRHPDGSVDKQTIALKVFADASLRADVESIVHPRVAERLKQILLASSADVVIYEVSALKETSDTTLADLLVEVVADVAIRRNRLLARGMSATDAEARIRAQEADASRNRRRDVVVTNNGSREELMSQAQRLYEAWFAHD